MRCHSISSTITDGYRAGGELGESLRAISPEVVLLFASINYESQFADVFDGLNDALDRPAIIFGGTSDGIYETDRAVHHGLGALGLNSDGAVRWAVTVESGVDADSSAAAHRCAERVIEELGGHADFAFAFADGVKADGSSIAAGLSAVLAIPFIGGLAADDRKFTASWIFAHGRTHQNAVGLLAARGPISVRINSASGWHPEGATGVVEECSGSTVQRISGMTPQEFLREQTGKAPGETDLGFVPFATYHPESNGHYFLRTPSHFDPETGAATMFGSVEKNATVRICSATREDVLKGVEQALKPTQQPGFTPCGALVVSCAGRKWLLEDRCYEEVEQVMQALGRRIPLVGMPTFGEMGPFLGEDGTCTPTFFHNVTFVVCLFGE